MRHRAALVASLLALPATVGLAAEQYKCVKVSADENGAFHQNPVETVELIIDQETVLNRVHIGAADRDFVFGNCKRVKPDGSSFGKLFSRVCTAIESVDDTLVKVDGSLEGAFAGVSLPIDPAYPMYENLVAAGEKAGSGTPARTFVIFAQRKPVYEFFCYPHTGQN